MNKYIATLLMLSGVVTIQATTTIEEIQNSSGQSVILRPYTMKTPYERSYNIADSRVIPVGESRNIQLPDRDGLEIITKSGPQRLRKMIGRTIPHILIDMSGSYVISNSLEGGRRLAAQMPLDAT